MTTPSSPTIPTTPSVADLLERLRALGDERAVAVWRRFGMNTSTYLGVSLTRVAALAKEVGRSQETAVGLWETGIHDARLLAVHVAEPKKVTPELAEKWVAEAAFFDVSDRVASKVVVKTPFAAEKMRAWLDADLEYARRAGWVLVRELADTNKLTDAEAGELLTRVEREIRDAPNWVREAQNVALIALGSRNPALHEAALAVVARIGKVVVDYGESSCQVPDARAHLTHPRVTDRWKST
jgi:3-methyladenine DNA glycosylase AlkD